MTAPARTDPPVIDAPGGGREQRWPLPVDEKSLLDIVHLLFEQFWDDIWFGVIVEGAAWEVAAPNAPEKISMYDGYVTVDFGRWHFHLCIGEHTASGPELGRLRRCTRAALYRSLDSTRPGVLGAAVVQRPGRAAHDRPAPNPFLTRTQQLTPQPIWA